MVGLVSDAEELEAKRHLDEAEHDLDTVEPRAGLAFHLFSSDGNIARIVNGKAKATEKASIVTIGVQNSP